MKKLEIVTTTYDVGDGWVIDIVDNPDIFDAWIYREGVGVKSFMFGWPKVQPTSLVTDYNGFLDMVMNQWEEYKEGYEEELNDLESAFNERYFDKD